MKSWFQQCRKEIELAKNKKKPPPDQSPDDPEFPHDAPTPTSTPPEDPPTHDTSSQIRMRALNTVVSGTGKLVQMLSTSSWSSDSTTPSDEEARHGGDGGEGYLNFKVDTPHLHSDDDLDSVCSVPRLIENPSGLTRYWLTLGGKTSTTASSSSFELDCISAVHCLGAPLYLLFR